MFPIKSTFLIQPITNSHTMLAYHTLKVQVAVGSYYVQMIIVILSRHWIAWNVQVKARSSTAKAQVTRL